MSDGYTTVKRPLEQRVRFGFVSRLEQWRPVIGYEGLYEVSNAGRVRRSGPSMDGKARIGRILRPAPASHGYPTVVLWRQGRGRTETIHRLVAAAFIGLCPDGHEVNHINGLKDDNDVNNLEYVTFSGNKAHQWAMKRRTASGRD